MTVALDEELIYRAKRRARNDGLTFDERVAINLLWRKGVGPSVIAEVFHVAKNTLYYKALTGKADSYPNSPRSNPAGATNAVIDRLGVARAERLYLTDEINAKVNEANRRKIARDIERRKRRKQYDAGTVGTA